MENLRDIYDGLVLFTDESYQAEQSEAKAVEDVNDVAKEISDELKGLGLNNSGGTSNVGGLYGGYSSLGE